MQPAKTWISRKAHLKSKKEPPFADSHYRSPEKVGQIAPPYPSYNPNPLCDDKGFPDDSLKTRGVTKNTVAVRLESDGVNSVVARASEPTVEVHPNEITHLNLNLLKKRASSWVRSKLHTQSSHASRPDPIIVISTASEGLSAPQSAPTNLSPSHKQGSDKALTYDSKPSDQAIAQEQIAVVKAQEAALGNTKTQRAKSWISRTIPSSTTFKSEKEQPQSPPTPQSQSIVQKHAEPPFSPHRQPWANHACLVDTTLFLNDVHVEELPDGRPSIYVHVCQSCDLPGVIFPIRQSKANAEDDDFRVKVEKGDCMSCGWSYDLRHEMYDDVGIEKLQKYRLQNRLIALRGDKHSNSPQAPNLLPLPTYDWHTLLPSVLEWGADNKWWKYKPPARPFIVPNPSLRRATFVDDILYLNDVTRVAKTFAMPDRPTRHSSVFDYVCPSCQHARVTFNYSDPKYANIRKDSSVMVSRTETADCPHCYQRYTLRCELLNGDALHKLRICRLNQVADCFKTGAWRSDESPPAAFCTYFPHRQHILINDVYIVDITGQPDLNAEHPRYAFACAHHAYGKWQSEHQVFFEFRKHERRDKPDGEALCQRRRCDVCRGEWVLWYVEVPRDEAARMKAGRK